MESAPQLAPDEPKLPARPVERFVAPIKRFLHVESASGIVLLLCAVLALVLANSPYARQFLSLWKTPVGISIGTFSLSGDLWHLVINDGLMAIFFFVVGLEIKRELVMGELRDPRRAMLPLFAALGGVLAPACIYIALQSGQPGARGWAVPMATDIAFVVGLLAIFGRRVPFSMKIVLLSLAIVDDLIAVLVIAFVFTGEIVWFWLGWAAIGFGLTYTLNRAGVRSIPIYVIIGVFIWYAVYQANVHPTVAGVLLGLLTPSSAWIGDATLASVVAKYWNGIKSGDGNDRDDLNRLLFAARESISPLERLETALHPWVAFVIMPLFALANAGVVLETSAVQHPVAFAVALGLVLGKPIGIVLMARLAIRFRLARMPSDVNWGIFTGCACIAGIGFTMALFINLLAFPEPEFAELAAAGKIGTLTGSLCSAVLGSIFILAAHTAVKKKQKNANRFSARS